jgi:hypothetical protein
MPYGLLELEKELKQAKSMGLGLSVTRRRAKRRRPAARREALAVPMGDRFNYRVPGPFNMVRQTNPVRCWAAAWTMMFSWREQMSFGEKDAVERLGPPISTTVYSNPNGCTDQDWRRIGTVAGLALEAPQNFPIEQWDRMLQDFGPIWIAVMNTGRTMLHDRILIGIRGGGNPTDTDLTFIDPDTGAESTVRFDRFLSDYEFVGERIAVDAAGNLAHQIMHWPKAVADQVRAGQPVRSQSLLPYRGESFGYDAQSLTATGIRFVNEGTNGWLRIKWEDGKGNYPDVLPFQLKVNVTKVENGREHFTVEEGLLKGRKGSVKLKSSDGKSFLSDKGEHAKAAEVEFNLTTNKLKVKGVGEFDAITDPDNPMPEGTHDIELPFEIHHLADKYLTDSPFATTWFRIGHSGDRFLHPGQISAGCTTVTDTKNWTDIYNKLIRARKDDKKSVGTIKVVK